MISFVSFNETYLLTYQYTLCNEDTFYLHSNRKLQHCVKFSELEPVNSSINQCCTTASCRNLAPFVPSLQCTNTVFDVVQCLR